jgi:hypothetical protein
MTHGDGPIEAYLDELLGRLRGEPRDIRRALCEAEDHLYAIAHAEVAAGADQHNAETKAIAQFGAAGTVANALNSGLPLAARTGPRSLPSQLTAVVGVGLVAIGLSGFLEQAMTWIWGSRFTFADPAGTRYPASACQHWESLHPHAATCMQAYVAESMADGLAQRYLAGLAGIAVLLTLVLIRRRRGQALAGSFGGVIPALLGTAAFGVAAVIFAALGADRLRVAAGNGAGQWLSAAVISAACAIGYLWVVTRLARRKALPA